MHGSAAQTGTNTNKVISRKRIRIMGGNVAQIVNLRKTSTKEKPQINNLRYEGS
jgi:hypothetical protein